MIYTQNLVLQKVTCLYPGCTHFGTCENNQQYTALRVPTTIVDTRTLSQNVYTVTDMRQLERLRVLQLSHFKVKRIRSATILADYESPDLRNLVHNTWLGSD